MRILSIGAALLIGLALSPVSAAQSATQDVTVIVQEITAISVAGAVQLTISAVDQAGNNPTAASSGGAASYAITTNGANKKIVAQIDAAFPTGISLAASMDAPSAGGSSAGSVTLGTSAQDLVTGLTRLRGSGIPLAYSATATVDAAPTTGETRTVTFTVTGN